MSTSTTAAVYLRISQDRNQDGLAVDRQRADCLQILKDRGWTLSREYVDTVSASRRDVKRPQYEALLQDVERGDVARVVVWDLDRLTRQPRQLEHWVDLAEQRGITLVTATGEADLTTDSGRLFARIKASVAAAEVERKSARQRRANQQKREKGLPPGGPRSFGYEPDGVTVRESEAVHVREAYAWVLGGGTLYGLRKHFAAAGLKTLRGNDWSQATVRQLLLRKRNCGRLHDGTPGSIEPIVDAETFDTVASILQSPDRTEPPGRKPVKFWLAGVAQCGTCGGPLKAARTGRDDYYQCRARAERLAPGDTRRHVAYLRENLEHVVRTAIEDAIVDGTLAMNLDTAEDLAAVQHRIAKARERQVRAQQYLLDGIGDAAVWTKAVREVDAELKDLRAERDRLALSGPSTDEFLARWQSMQAEPEHWTLEYIGKHGISPELHAELRLWDAFWDSLTMENRRDLARAIGPIRVVSGRGDDRVRIGPAGS